LRPVSYQMLVVFLLSLNFGDALLLVNRILEGRFDCSSGIELIESMKNSAGVKMLISNLPDAQAEAEKAGAVKGFGKAKAYDPATLALVRKTMGI